MKPIQLISVINQAFNVDITSKKRDQRTSYARFIFCKIMREKYTLSGIGSFINRGHDSVFNALKRYDELIIYQDFRDMIELVELELKK